MKNTEITKNDQIIKPLTLTDLPPLDPQYANYQEEFEAKFPKVKADDNYSTLKHIPNDLAGNVM